MESRSIRLSARLIGILVLLALFALRAAAADVNIPPIQIHTLKLLNGLRVVMVNRGEAPVITVEVWYHVGSRNETPGKTGYAHLLEHLMFDGTRTLGRHFSDYIVRVGGVDNAYTTNDATVFWETMPASNLPAALWLEADRMRNLEINQTTVDKERAVVEEERRRRYENPPYGTVIPALYENAFTVSPYRHLPIGSTDDVSRATADEIRDFYNTYYVPNNATIVIVGRFSLEDAVKSILKYFESIPAGMLPATASIPVEPPQTADRVVGMARNVALPAFVAAYHIPADGSPDSYPLELASRILSAGDSGMVYHQLVYEQQLALEAQTSAGFSEDPNLFFVFAVMNSGHTLAEGEAAVDAIIKRLQDEPLSPAEIEKAKNQVLFELASGRENSKDLAEQLGYDSVVLNDPDLINSAAERFLAVTAEQVQAVARKYFVHSNRTILEVSPHQNGPVAATLHAGGH
ncbi:MAG: insulinase family protein [Acidobacteria bacterium]|nr:MAG: insulinase family protein [Acidobacteriota bacterium]